MQFLQVHFLDIFRFFNTSEGSCQEEMQALSPIVIIIEGLEIDFHPTGIHAVIASWVSENLFSGSFIRTSDWQTMETIQIPIPRKPKAIR